MMDYDELKDEVAHLWTLKISAEEKQAAATVVIAEILFQMMDVLKNR